MTFSIIHENQERVRKIIGTLWAADEASASVLANEIFAAIPRGSFVIVRAEEREIPLRIGNASNWSTSFNTQLPPYA